VGVPVVAGPVVKGTVVVVRSAVDVIAVTVVEAGAVDVTRDVVSGVLLVGVNVWDAVRAAE